MILVPNRAVSASCMAPEPLSSTWVFAESPGAFVLSMPGTMSRMSPRFVESWCSISALDISCVVSIFTGIRSFLSRTVIPPMEKKMFSFSSPRTHSHL